MGKEKINLERLTQLFNQVMDEAQNIGIPISRNIYGPIINTRAKARFGCCIVENKVPGNTWYTIEISAHTLEAPEKSIKEIIAHELLHTCKGCMNHGKIWKIYAERFNESYGYNITRTSSAEILGLEETGKNIPPAKYILVCSKCGKQFPRKRRSKAVQSPEKYRCGKCGGQLKSS